MAQCSNKQNPGSHPKGGAEKCPLHGPKGGSENKPDLPDFDFEDNELEDFEAFGISGEVLEDEVTYAADENIDYLIAGTAEAAAWKTLVIDKNGERVDSFRGRKIQDDAYEHVSSNPAQFMADLLETEAGREALKEYDEEGWSLSDLVYESYCESPTPDEASKMTEELHRAAIEHMSPYGKKLEPKITESLYEGICDVGARLQEESQWFKDNEKHIISKGTLYGQVLNSDGNETKAYQNAVTAAGLKFDYDLYDPVANNDGENNRAGYHAMRLKVTNKDGHSEELMYHFGPAVSPNDIKPKDILWSVNQDGAYGDEQLDSFMGQLGYDSDDPKATANAIYEKYKIQQNTAKLDRLLNADSKRLLDAR